MVPRTAILAVAEFEIRVRIGPLKKLEAEKKGKN